MLQIKDLTFSYSKKQAPVLGNVNLTLEDGRIYGLLGLNGTGKSTMLYLISGLLRPTLGSISYNGEDVTRRLPSTLEDMFIVTEEYDLPAMSVEEYCRQNGQFYPHYSQELFDKCMAAFELTNTKTKLNKMSMGTKKKVYISFAIATQTKLLLMDEPTNGLDIPSKAQFRKAISLGMSDDRTVIISTHQVRDVDSILDHIVMIGRNEVLLNETIASIEQKLSFEERPAQESLDDALFSMPSVRGNAVLTENTAGEESTINLELLFNGVVAETDRIKAIFAKKQTNN